MTMRAPLNPFLLTGYHSPAYFCDREQEFAWLQEQFANERNVMIYSWRRTGKTALIRHFYYHMELRKQADCLFVDLLGTDSLAEANRRVAAAVVQRFGEWKKGIMPSFLGLLGKIGASIGLDPMSGAPQLTFSLVPGQAVADSLDALGEFLASRKKPVVICLDEFQQVTEYEDGSAEATFRTWMQNYPMVRFIFSGSHRHLMTAMFSDQDRPFYRSTQLLSLEPIEAEAYTRFITAHFKKGGFVISGEQISRIFDWTRKQTYYVQLVCNQLYGKQAEVEDNMLEEVFDSIIQQQIPTFSTYQTLLTSYQWKLLMAVAKAEQVESPMAKEFLAQYNLGAASSVGTALQMLVRKELIIQHEGHYTLHDTLLMRWLQLM
jgi:uncharacterized protein